MQPILILLGALLVGALIYFSWLAAKKRREAFQAWATKNNWSYDPSRSREVYHQYQFLDKLRQGSNRYAFDIVRGEWKGRSAEGFTFHFETHSTDSKGNRRTHHHHFGVVLIQIEREFSELSIHPEGFFSKIGQFFGYDDIDFESVEFSKKFCVRAEDKKLAYDFCNTGMMEYLLQNPKTGLELEGNTLALYDTNRLDPDEIEPYLQHLSNIRGLMPEYLFRD
ncbi:MAG: hypothetical protein QGH51_04960 [Planctomycetota bacterium]|jgi:hypothetical protein|nr:hypothetical protein [Planctomycetota bacterium]MDP6941362.1 hypothetical protein [Planctomycetota bacterium]